MELVTGTSGSAQVPYAINGWFTIDPGMATSGLGTTPSNQVIATLPGYAIVYIDNQTIGKEVWFDNLMVGHYTSEVVEENHYYPFGLTLQTDANLNVTGNPYKYNGKELERSFELETYEYGARQYNSQIGRWNSIDPLADKYYSISAFAYVANRPTIAIDLDGRKILFVNGFHSDNVVGRNVIGSGKGGEAYWGKGFSNAAQTFFNDHSDINGSNYIDGSSKLGADKSGNDRYKDGRSYAEKNIKSLTSGLNEGETFKMVTHSEGAAYGAGVASYLIEKGYTVETVAHLSPDEADEFTTPSEPMTYYLSYNGDWITSNMTMRGADKLGLVDRSDLGLGTIHGSTKGAKVFKELSDLKNLEVQRVGSYYNGWDDTPIYKQNKSTTLNGTKFKWYQDTQKKYGEVIQ